MKILFAVKKSFAAPLGVMALSAYLKSKGAHETGIADLSLEEIQKTLRSNYFDMLAFSCTDFDSFRESCLIASMVKKEHNIFIAVGGAHVGLFDFDIRATDIDGLCVGEGEEALLEFANKYDENKFLGNIPNWTVKIKGQVYRNEVRSLIQDLDALPFPDRELCRQFIPYDKLGIFNKMDVHFVSVSRGCPYKCTYCHNNVYQKLYQDKGCWYRRRKAENVIKELRLLKKQFSPSMFVFIDDTFILVKEWFREFASDYSKEIQIPYFCQSRPDLITEEIAFLLKQSNCKLISMGIESGNDYVRNVVFNRNISKEQIISAARLIKRNKIHLCTLNVLGAPGSSLENDIETIALNIKCRPDTPVPYLFHPLPQIDLTSQAIDMGLFDKDYEYAKNKFYGQGAQKVNLNKGKTKPFQINNLYHFFHLLIKYPFLGFFSRVLINIPFGDLLYKYASRFKRRKHLASKFDFFIEQ